jgi:hypothetical protein
LERTALDWPRNVLERNVRWIRVDEAFWNGTLGDPCGASSVGVRRRGTLLERRFVDPRGLNGEQEAAAN